MIPKIIFFDIDGTLKSFNKKTISPVIISALNKLKEKNIKIFVSTGRPPFMIPHFEGIEFDGYICFNGSYCYDNQQVLFKHPINKSDIKQVIQNGKKMGLPVMLSGVNRFGANFYNEDLSDYIKISKDINIVIDDYDDLLEEDIFQMMVGGREEIDIPLLENTKTLKVARWWDRANDIISKDCGKSQGIKNILNIYHFKREETLAFGDGGNDLDMLEYAGVGIAMGNAMDHVKQAADYVTDDVDHDGIYTALKHFHII
ncbi:hydrolase [Eggerthia catenaformis]|nr:hydrolase [Eggerthia catenaformis]